MEKVEPVIKLCSRRGRYPHLPSGAKTRSFSIVPTKGVARFARLPRRLGLRDLAIAIMAIAVHHVATAALNCANSRSMASFTLPSANSAATRTAFLMAFVFDEPWVMMQTPFTPSSGAPPYSV
jgi:hypothetical protein